MSRRTPVILAAFATLAGAATLVALPAQAEGRLWDSDDYACHHGAPDDWRTQGACERLRGYPMDADAIALERSGGRARDSDDWVCQHGRPDARRTREACANLRRDVPGEPGSIDPNALALLDRVF